MDQRLDARAVEHRVEGAHECRRMRPHDVEQRLNRVQHARHAAEREAGRAEADDLAIVRPREPANDVDRIGGGVDV